jgi:hypothetical protein
MENLLIGMLLLSFAFLSGGKKLPYLMAAGCFSAAIIEALNFDIALYYSFNAILLSLLAFYAIKIKSTSSLTYAIIMTIQMLFCIVLIPDWGYSANALIQNAAIYYNDYLLIAVVVIGVIGIDDTITNTDYSSNNRDSRDNNRTDRDY